MRQEEFYDQSLQSAANGLGAASVAAMSAGSRIQSFFGGTMESVGAAMATYSSQNMGARHYERIKKASLLLLL